MRKSLKTAVSAALCGAVALTALPANVLAGPMSAADPSTVGLSAPVDTVYYRRYRYGGYYPRRYYRSYDPGAALFAGAAAGLIGAGIAASSRPYYGGYYPYYGGGYYPYYGGAWGWDGGWGGGWGW